MMRLDANLTWLFTELPFEERFDAAAAAGFEGVEFASPYEYSPNVLTRRLADAGLTQVLVNSPRGAAGTPTSSGSACIPGLINEFRRGMDTALEYASALGASVIHVMGGVRPADISPDHAFATYVNNIGWAAERAAGSGVTLVLEVLNQRDIPGFVLGSMEQAAAVVSAIGVDHVRLLFDVYHCQVGQGDLATRIQSLMHLVGHVQIADAPHRTEPGTGEIAWNFLFQQLQAAGYDGWVGCEYAPVTNTLDGLAWREQFLVP